MQQWEYEFRSTDFVAMDKQTLEGLGEEGWELVSVVVLNERTYYYFKRPKQEEEKRKEQFYWHNAED